MNPLFEESIKLSISEDKMEARIYLSSTPMNWGENITDLYTQDNLLAYLKEMGIKAGIDKTLLQSVVINKLYDSYYLIAVGKNPVNGIDGYFTYNFKTTLDNKPKILPDGSVDYQNIDQYEPVCAGQEIATYTPPTSGQYGYTVTGEMLTCVRGKDLLPLKGEGFTVSEDGLHYYSGVNGKIELFNNGLRVSNLLDVEGDVDLVSGNIVFSGDVIIRGNVATGVSIQAAGNVTIMGNVEGATIYSGGNIELKSGMQGSSRGSITCDGEVWGKFFESASIHCKGDFHANSIMNCDLLCESDIYITGRFGIIVGGTTTCYGSIEATVIGNLNEVRTTISSGVSQNSLMEINGLENDIKELNKKQEKLIAVQEKILSIKHPTDQERLSNISDQIKTSLAIIQGDIKLKNTELNQKLFLLSQYSKSRIKITKYLYPNVKIMINGLHYSTTTAFSNLTISEVGGEVQLLSN